MKEARDLDGYIRKLQMEYERLETLSDGNPGKQKGCKLCTKE